MSRTQRIGVLAASVLLACISPSRAAEDYSLRQPAPVKVRAVVKLPVYCVSGSLAENTQVPAAVEENSACPPIAGVPRVRVAAGNVDDIVSKLQPSSAAATITGATVAASAAAAGTATVTATGPGIAPQPQFALTASSDKKSIIVFCRAGSCEGETDLLKAIRDLAKPRYSYFKDYAVASRAIGNALSKAVPAINSKLTAETAQTGYVRVESDKTLLEADLTLLDERIAADTAAIVAAAKLEKDPTTKELGGADPDVQVSGKDLPNFCQADSLADSSKAPDDDGKCSPGTRLVPAGNIDAVITAANSALGTSAKFKLSKDGNRILVACDGKCSGDAIDLIKATITATARPVPLYVKDIDVPRGTAYTVAKAMTYPPVTAIPLIDTKVRLTSETPVTDGDLDIRREFARQRGFGDAETPSLQRLFYRRAPDVVGDLLTTPSAETLPSLGGNAATAPVTTSETASPAPAGSSSAASTAGTTTAAPGTTISITNNPTPATPTPAAPASPGPAPIGTLGQGMTAVGDSVVFTDTTSPSAIRERVRLLTLLDLPRPEVIMNMWSLQASSPDGPEVARNLQKVRDTVNENNDALQHAIDYGWAYLSRQIKEPDAFFDQPFYRYLTERFVAESEDCEASEPGAQNCLTDDQRRLWGLCKKGQYCLGYTDAFQPLRPTLTNIILAMIAAKRTPETVLTTIGCMEGKFEVYGNECFPDRNGLWSFVPLSDANSASEEADITRTCLKEARETYLSSHLSGKGPSSCDLLDRAAIAAQKACKQPATLPLSCFTIQAAKSFLPVNSFSTFSLKRLNDLAEERIADIGASLPPQASAYSASSLGVLRGAVVDFLFNYKVSQQYPAEFGPYSLPHSAQELNALFNPLVIAFNQDVSALSGSLMDRLQSDLPNQNSFWELWRHNKTYVANGMVTVRGISGVESLVDSDTQNAFDSTQAQTLSAVLASLMSPGSSAASASGTTNTNANSLTVNAAGVTVPVPTPPASTPTPGPGCSSNPTSPLCEAAILLRGTSTAGGIATALAALTPTPTHSIIGRQLTLDVIPHTLPGASSAELDVRLWAQEDSAPTIYSSSGSSSDFQSRVARHNVATRVRVESVKLFDVSSMTAMVQRPRARLPIVPPFIEIPIIHDILSIPLPAAKIYHASTAIVSAIIVPTAADLAYGLVFTRDRGVFPEDRRFSHMNYSLRPLTSQRQLPGTAPIYRYHEAMVKCLASNGFLAIPASNNGVTCGDLKFSLLPPDR